MEKSAFNKILLNTAFCCMVIDSKIDNREVSKIIYMCKKTHMYKDFNFQDEINALISMINNGAKEFVTYYLDMVKSASLTEKQELLLIDFAINTIKADDRIKFAEVKFFKIIRPYLNVSNEKIISDFPDTGQFLVKGKISESFMKKITTMYLDNIELPKFEFISSFDNGSNDKSL
jgi:uncharacterized tellurite resistance protein B-like protein